MSKRFASSMSYCELTLAAKTRDKATGAHSFQMSTGRCGATEKEVTAGGEISVILVTEKSRAELSLKGTRRDCGLKINTFVKIKRN